MDVSDFYGWQHTKKEKLNTIPSSTTVIDLTDDDDGLILPDKSGLHCSNSTTDSLYGGTTDIYSFSDETYISIEAKCSGTGQYCIRSTPRSPSTGPQSTPSTKAHSDTTYSSTQASFSTMATSTIPIYVTEFLTEPDRETAIWTVFYPGTATKIHKLLSRVYPVADHSPHGSLIPLDQSL